MTDARIAGNRLWERLHPYLDFRRSITTSRNIVSRKRIRRSVSPAPGGRTRAHLHDRALAVGQVRGFAWLPLAGSRYSSSGPASPRAACGCGRTRSPRAASPPPQCWLSARERSRQPEPRQHAVVEAGHGAYPIAGKGEHVEAGRVADSGRDAQVCPERGVAVGSGRHEVESAARTELAGAVAGHEFTALVSEGLRRHGDEDVVGQQGDQRVKVGRLPRPREHGDDRVLGGRARGGRRLVAGGRLLAALQASAGSLERAVDRFDGHLQHAGYLAGAESEDVAQDEYGDLARR